jgi:small-conductance mechanosensitive channel
MDPAVQRQWLVALGVLVGAWLLGYLVSVVVVRRLSVRFKSTTTDLDDIILAAVRRHLPLWFFLGGLSAAVHLAPVGERIVSVAGRACAAGFMISLTLVAANLGTAFLGRYARRAGTPNATTSLTQNVLRAVILASGFLLVLANLGVSITPLLTALGVGSLAVALALQPTLSNLFAGMHMALARPLRVGDFIELETGARGHVVDIGWRSTRIRDLPNNLIIVPNARLVEMVVTNYSLPVSELSVPVQLGVSYAADLEHVERVTLEVAREVLREVRGGVPEFETAVRYESFGESSVRFSVILRARQFTDRGLVIHEFVKRLHRRYAAEGIEIPFPQRELHGTLVTLGSGTLPPPGRMPPAGPPPAGPETPPSRTPPGARK